MGERPFRIGVVAPGGRIAADLPQRVSEAIHAGGAADGVEVAFHPQCFEAWGHFAGDDAARQGALVEVANDPEVDAVWFARGGYGACRIAEAAIAQLGEDVRDKPVLGYSDGGYLLAGLYRAGFRRLAHGPMPCDAAREGGAEAMRRAIDWMTGRSDQGLEPSLRPGQPAAAFNITVLSQLLGTPLEPDLTGHVLMLEEVYEYMYRIDRSLFHITSNASIRRVAGIRLGRCSAVPQNDPDFERTEEEVVAYWCERSAIPYLGRADIGHDAENSIVPFGGLPGRG